jgi:hypothetical protein
MRLFGVLAIGIGVAASIASAAEATFPYPLVVGERPVEMRSGPGPTYYVTGVLASGTRIEVHRQDADGWLAIRPTAESFSLVRRSQLEATDQPDVARVTENEAPCRVGSSVERAGYPVSQVRLRKGELVELLDPDGFRATAGGEGWCRIAPPAGEFRWVKAADVQPGSTLDSVKSRITGLMGLVKNASTPAKKPETPGPSASPLISAPPVTPAPSASAAPAAAPTSAGAAALSAAAKSPPPSVPSNPSPAERPAEPRVIAPPPVERVGIGPEKPPASPPPTQPATDWQLATSTAKKTGDTPAPLTASPPTEPPAPREAVKLLPEVATAPKAKTAPPPSVPAAVGDKPDAPPASVASPDLTSWIPRNKVPTSELRRVEAELTKTVSQEVHAWRLAPLRRQLEAWSDKLESAVDQARARELLRRIAEFEKLQDRFVQSAAGQTVTNVAAGTPAAPATATFDSVPAPGEQPPVSALTGGSEVRYDGSGWLVPVHSTKQTAPPYALLDAEGNVLQYVSPAPGLNLNRYLRKQVGIYGQRGYMQTLQKAHLTAERVVDLNRHLR